MTLHRIPPSRPSLACPHGLPSYVLGRSHFQARELLSKAFDRPFFFTATIRNRNTRLAYARACRPNSDAENYVNGVLDDSSHLGGCIGCMVTAVGWFVFRWGEDRQRAIERQMKYCERQIEEFYGPLFSLIHEIFSAEEVQENFIEAKSEREAEIRSYFQRNYFLPLHAEMIQMFGKTKWFAHKIIGGQSMVRVLLRAGHPCRDF